MMVNGLYISDSYSPGRRQMEFSSIYNRIKKSREMGLWKIPRRSSFRWCKTTVAESNKQLLSKKIDPIDDKK